MIATQQQTPRAIQPKFVKKNQWRGYVNPPWMKRDKRKVTILYNFVERRKSFFLRAYWERSGYAYRDLGDYVKEDVRWGKEFGNRMECNPMYFTSGSLLRNLFKIQQETGHSKLEMVERYIFVGGGGQCGPCRYGMYPQEYWKALNDAGFKGFRTLIFSSGFSKEYFPKGSAFKFGVAFRLNMTITFVLADFMHIAECALRPYAKDKAQALEVVGAAENMLLEAFRSRFYFFKVPAALRKAGKMLREVPRHPVRLPLIYVTGEIFANLAHNEGNYNLRRFIMDEDCEAMPGLFTNRVLYDFWRRRKNILRDLEYCETWRERMSIRGELFVIAMRRVIVCWFYDRYRRALKPELFGGRPELNDLDRLADIGFEHYHPEIFGGEGNLEVAEALHYADKVDGFISSKPFGCMPSSGVSDGVQAKIMALHPHLNFLSIETSGDNEVNILSRVSMLLFKAKQKVTRELELGTDTA
jgi:predicted nucleotide-binding protein (sugar kinase/HSP70/actin superfamily)